MNAVVLVASFCLMTGSYFSAIMMLVALGISVVISIAYLFIRGKSKDTA
ncbi:hypothetical protein [Clostridium sp. OS1-26]|nr:hypothetical protein [Clostridium sp. OS1-26]WML32775.1 hypothetical protein RCG18_15530 [Clostridium sp. OS1-26]